MEKAKSLLAEAGYPDGFDVVLTIGTQNAYVQAATLVQEQLKQIGVNVEIQSVSSTEVTDRYLNNKVQLWINGQGARPTRRRCRLLPELRQDPHQLQRLLLQRSRDRRNHQRGADAHRPAGAQGLYEELNEIALKTNIAAFYATTKLSWGLRKEVHGFVQENKAIMRVCGLEALASTSGKRSRISAC